MTIKPYLANILRPYKKGIYLETSLANGNSSKLALNLDFKKVISIEIDKNNIKFTCCSRIQFYYSWSRLFIS